MGAGYSQPPRGYQYSVVDENNKKCRSDPDMKEFENVSSFSDLFQNNWANEKKFTYISEVGPNGSIVCHSYEECDQKIQDYKAELIRFSRSKPLGIYALNNFQSILIHDAAVINKIPVIASGPGYQTPEEFVRSAKEMNVGAIYCDKVLQPGIQGISSIPVFSDIHHIPSFDTTRSSDEIEYDLCSAKDTRVKYAVEEMLPGLEAWAKRLKICRDAKVVNAFPIGHNLNRLIRYVCIAKRATVCVGTDLEKCSVFNATHYFGPHEIFEQHIETKKEQKKAKGLLYRLKYGPNYMWKNVKMSLGGSSEFADKRVFKEYQTDFGTEMRFMFTDKAINPELHELFTIIYTLPLSVIYVPEAWINYGTCTPPDPRFTKFGTAGGPVGCSITIEGATVKCSKSDVSILEKAFWDEEGSIFFIEI